MVFRYIVKKTHFHLKTSSSTYKVFRLTQLTLLHSGHTCARYLMPLGQCANTGCQNRTHASSSSALNCSTSLASTTFLGKEFQSSTTLYILGETELPQVQPVCFMIFIPSLKSLYPQFERAVFNATEASIAQTYAGSMMRHHCLRQKKVDCHTFQGQRKYEMCYYTSGITSTLLQLTYKRLKAHFRRGGQRHA